MKGKKLMTPPQKTKQNCVSDMLTSESEVYIKFLWLQ